MYQYVEHAETMETADIEARLAALLTEHLPYDACMQWHWIKEVRGLLLAQKEAKEASGQGG